LLKLLSCINYNIYYFCWSIIHWLSIGTPF